MVHPWDSTESQRLDELRDFYDRQEAMRHYNAYIDTLSEDQKGYGVQICFAEWYENEWGKIRKEINNGQ